MKTVRFGLIGCGLMGREFISAAARWCHLPDMPVRPEIVAIYARNHAGLEWYRKNISSLKQITDDTIIGDVKDRCFRVFVDRDDRACIFHSDDVLDRS